MEGWSQEPGFQFRTPMRVDRAQPLEPSVLQENRIGSPSPASNRGVLPALSTGKPNVHPWTLCKMRLDYGMWTQSFLCL